MTPDQEGRGERQTVAGLQVAIANLQMAIVSLANICAEMRVSKDSQQACRNVVHSLKGEPLETVKHGE